jgi:hypothetical protein
MVLVFAIAESYEKAGIGNRFHLRKKPFLAERFAGPALEPASRIKGWLSDFLAFSS